MSLAGKHILITRPVDQAETITRLLHEREAEAVYFPTIQIQPPKSWDECDDTIDTFRSYDAVIFTSVNAVRYFFNRAVERGLQPGLMPKCTVYVVGAKTADAVASYGIMASRFPGVTNVRMLAEALCALPVRNKRFLFPKGNLAGSEIAELLRAQKAMVDEVVVYETAAAQRDGAHETSELTAAALRDAAHESTELTADAQRDGAHETSELTAAALRDAAHESTELTADAQRDGARESSELTADAQRDGAHESSELTADAQRDGARESSELTADAQRDGAHESSELTAEALCARLRSRSIDAVTFFSPSSVDNFFAIMPQDAIGATAIAAIGDTTAEALRALSMPVHIVPAHPTSEDLVTALDRYFAAEAKP